jgi:hypothetical protein
MVLDVKTLRKIERLAEHVGGEVYRQYSGRGMCGDTCIGITSEDDHSAMKKINGFSPCRDNLGRDYIIYWSQIIDDGTTT